MRRKWLFTFVLLLIPLAAQEAVFRLVFPLPENSQLQSLDAARDPGALHKWWSEESRGMPVRRSGRRG